MTHSAITHTVFTVYHAIVFQCHELNLDVVSKQVANHVLIDVLFKASTDSFNK